jgi:alpha-glucoside transport system substrate-binding protein
MKKSIRLAAAVASAALAVSALGAAPASAADEVSIYTGMDAPAIEALQADLDKWSASSGVKVKLTRLASFDTDITTKIKAGQEPDIAFWPQPGGLIAQANAGKLVDLSTLLGSDLTAIKKTLVSGWDKLAVTKGKLYGLPAAASVKSLVFYNPANLKKLGYSVPKTDAELQALEKKVVADGKAYPWCAGIESGGATGWPATDWVEDYAVKYLGVDYNLWWQGNIQWSDSRIQKAGKAVAARLLTKGNTQPGVASRNFGDATTAGLFATTKAKGQCLFLKQGSFITSFFPTAVQAEIKKGNLSRVGVFKLPTPAGATDAVLGAGDVAAAFHNTPAVKKVMSYILSDKSLSLAKGGFYLAPHKTVKTSVYPNKLQAQFATILSSAKAFGFDGSDLAPTQVNATEWKQLTNWFSGTKTMSQAFKAIDDSYFD